MFANQVTDCRAVVEKEIKMKRLIILSILSSVLLMCFTGCGNETGTGSESSAEATASESAEIETAASTEDNTESVTTEAATEQPTEAATDATDYNEAYSEIIEGFRSVITDGMGDETEILGDPSVLYDISGREAEYNLGYAIEDLSGDGIPELAIATINEKRDGIGYGDLVYAVYTCHDDTVSLAFEGSYRSSYHYKGDGTFFYRGSGGAMYSIFGSFTLQPDGKSLKCNDYYFTYEKDETFTEIGFYHNTTGVSDKKQSEELNITEDEFWGKCTSLETKPVEIALTPFVEEYAAKAPSQLFVEYNADTSFNEDSCDFYSVEQSEYATRIVFSTDGVLHDFKLLSLCMTDVDEEGNPEYSIDDIYSYGTLEAYRPLIVELVFYGDTPSYGVSYTDETGETRRLAVSMSGYDGSLELFEF